MLPKILRLRHEYSLYQIHVLHKNMSKNKEYFMRMTNILSLKGLPNSVLMDTCKSCPSPAVYNLHAHSKIRNVSGQVVE